MEGLFVGIVSGVVSAVIVAAIQHLFIWRTEKRAEMKLAVFELAATALALWEADARDLEYQETNKGGKGLKPVTKLRAETMAAKSKARALVPALFSKEAADAFGRALRAHVEPGDIEADEQFFRLSADAMALMAQEITPSPRFPLGTSAPSYEPTPSG